MAFVRPRFRIFVHTIVATVTIALTITVPVVNAIETPANTSDLRQSQESLFSKSQQIRARYDELVQEIDRTQQAILEKRIAIVGISGELLRREQELTRKTVDFHNMVRLAYKYGPGDLVEAVLEAKSFAEAELARRLLSAQIDGRRRVLDEMIIAHIAVTNLAAQLEEERAELQSRVDRLLDAVDATQAALADTEAALAAARQELKVREQMQRALRILKEVGADSRYTQRHRLSSERQAEILARYPFGAVTGIPDGLRPTGEVIEGIASWYGPGFHGLPTASGAIFDENLYTCASKELPLGTILLVTYQGRSVLVLVNDRGPFVPGRVLDLSKAAKEAIGMGGLGYVTAQVLEPV